MLVLQNYSPKILKYKPINYTFSQGIYTLLGQNGVGKSTFLYSLIDSYTGSAKVQNIELASLSQKQKAKKIAFVSQNFAPVFALSVSDFVRLANDECDITKILNQLKIIHLKDKAITALSGGELALVRIAAALASGAKIIVLDEPLAALDISKIAVVLGILQDFSKERCIIFSCHNPNYALGKIISITNDADERNFEELSALNETNLEKIYQCKIIKKLGFYTF